jgi:hypothetical protein
MIRFGDAMQKPNYRREGKENKNTSRKAIMEIATRRYLGEKG